jgi:hypothetical protein
VRIAISTRAKAPSAWETVLGIIAAFALLTISGLLTEWPLDRRQATSVVILAVFAAIAILLVQAKKVMIAAILFLLAFKWIIAAFYVPSIKAGIFGATLAIAGFILAKISPEPSTD